MLMRSMEKARQRRLAGEGGFTLVELIVVIAILGILAAIVVFAVGGITNKGQTEADKTTCSVLQTAEEAYFAKNSSYALDDGTSTGQEKLQQAKFLHTVNDAFTIESDPDVGYKVVGPQCETTTATT